MSYYAGMGKNNKKSMEQIPEEVFDFHRYTTTECKEALDDLIQGGEYTHIRLIIGKGLHSVNGPVLPSFVKNYLNDRNIRFNQSKIQDGGEGALEVFLK